MLRKCRIAQSKFRSGSGRNWKSTCGSGPVPAGTQKRIPVHPYYHQLSFSSKPFELFDSGSLSKKMNMLKFHYQVAAKI